MFRYVARHGVLTQREATLAEEPRMSWQFEPNPDATPVQQEHLQDWLQPTP